MGIMAECELHTAFLTSILSEEEYQQESDLICNKLDQANALLNKKEKDANSKEEPNTEKIKNRTTKIDE